MNGLTKHLAQGAADRLAIKGLEEDARQQIFTLAMLPWESISATIKRRTSQD